MTRARAIVAAILSLVLGYSIAVALGPDRLPHIRRHPRFGNVNAFVRVPTHDRVVALTFDDGPDPRWTPTVLQQLRRHRAHATFFLVGEHAAVHPELVKAERRAGDEIGNHTYSHPDLELLDPAEVKAEITQGATAIERAGGGVPHLFRPPKGFTDQIVGVLADADRYRTVYWSLTLEHFVDHQDVAVGTEQMLSRVRPGMILLAHDGGIPNRTPTMTALPLLLDGLRARGYRIVTVSELLKHRRKAPSLL